MRTMSRFGWFAVVVWLLIGSLPSGTLAAAPKLRCGAPTKCPDGVLGDVRAATDAACPCDAAGSPKAYTKCWKPVVKDFVSRLGKSGFPKACRAEVGRALATTTCGRSSFALCRKVGKAGTTCSVAKATKCKDPFPTGRSFASCVDACDGNAALPFPSTVELSTVDLRGLDSDDPDGTMRFGTAPASLAGVAVGNVLVGGVSSATPAGLLRVVLAVERDGNALTLRTGQAPIQLAYRKLHARTARSTPVTSAGDATSSRAARARAFEAKKPFDYVLFDGDGDTETKNDQIVVDGEIGGGFDYDFALDVDWGDVTALPDVVTNCLESLPDILVGDPPSCSVDSLLPEAKVTFIVHPQVNANANVHGAAILAYEKSVELASETLTPIIVGPLVFVPKADVTADLSGGASAGFTTGVHGSAVFETSVTVSSMQTQTPQFQEPVLQSTDFGPNETSVSLQAFAKVGVGASLNLLLFGVTGPYATARPYAAIEANILDAPCWNLHAGLEADLGVKVTSPALPLIGEVTLVDWKAPTIGALDVPLASGGCDAPPDASSLPPGAGPDAVHLANPTYTPWSRAWSSPVDGAQAQSPGNGVAFSDLQHTIDGRWVRAGYGVTALTKLDDAGALTWARELRLDDALLPPLRVRSATDATMMVASSLGGVAPIVLTKVAQDGSVVDARAWDVPLDVCNVELAALAADGAGGFWVSGACIGDPRAFALHAGRTASTFFLLGDLGSLRLNVADHLGDDAFLAGSTTEGTDAMVALRLRPDGSLAYAKRYDGCLNAPDAIPSASIVGTQEDVTLAGSGGAQHNGLVMRILGDGSVGFATFPGFGFGAGSVFLLDSLVELPTTGYVAGGSTVRFTANEPENVPSAALVGFDAAGHIIWANRYSFGSTGAYAASGHVAVGLSDDGGVVTTSLLADAFDPFTGGRLWAFKPFAKDGDIDFLPDAVTTTALGITDLSCSMTASNVAVTASAVEIPTRAVTVTSTPVDLALEQQTTD